MSNTEPYFELAINGKKLDFNMLEYVVEVQVEEAGAKASLARITVADWDKIWMNDKGISKGSKISVTMGHVGNYRRVFYGSIENVEADFPEEGVPYFVITGLDDGILKLKEKKYKRSFKKEKESAVISRMIREAGMVAEVEDSKTIVDLISQNNITTMEFIDKFCKKKSWYHYKTPNQTYYVGSKPEPKSNISDIGYKTGGNEIKAFRPTFTEIKKEEG